MLVTNWLNFFDARDKPRLSAALLARQFSKIGASVLTICAIEEHQPYCILIDLNALNWRPRRRRARTAIRCFANSCRTVSRQ